MRNTLGGSSPQQETPKSSLGWHIFLTFLPLVSAYVYTWVLGANKEPLRIAQSIGWFSVSLAAKHAVVSFKKTPEYSVWAIGSLFVFLLGQSITAMFEPFAIIAIIIYGLMNFIIQISIVSSENNAMRMAFHSAICATMLYFVVQEYFFLEGLCFWIAALSAISVCTLSIKRQAKMKK